MRLRKTNKVTHDSAAGIPAVTSAQPHFFSRSSPNIPAASSVHNASTPYFVTFRRHSAPRSAAYTFSIVINIMNMQIPAIPGQHLPCPLASTSSAHSAAHHSNSNPHLIPDT